MIPVLLILRAAPQPGQSYDLLPIIGNTQPRTAVYRGMVHTEEVIRTAKEVYGYQYDLGEFVDVETGELFLREIEY